jgi:hypothetical protein
MGLGLRDDPVNCVFEFELGYSGFLVSLNRLMKIERELDSFLYIARMIELTFFDQLPAFLSAYSCDQLRL